MVLIIADSFHMLLSLTAQHLGMIGLGASGWLLVEHETLLISGLSVGCRDYLKKGLLGSLYAWERLAN